MGDLGQNERTELTRPSCYILLIESFGKKHEIAQVTAQLQAQVKVANLGQKHKKNDFFRVNPTKLLYILEFGKT